MIPTRRSQTRRSPCASGPPLASARGAVTNCKPHGRYSIERSNRFGACLRSTAVPRLSVLALVDVVEASLYPVAFMLGALAASGQAETKRQSRRLANGRDGAVMTGRLRTGSLLVQRHRKNRLPASRESERTRVNGRMRPMAPAPFKPETGLQSFFQKGLDGPSLSFTPISGKALVRAGDGPDYALEIRVLQTSVRVLPDMDPVRPDAVPAFFRFAGVGLLKVGGVATGFVLYVVLQVSSDLGGTGYPNPVGSTLPASYIVGFAGFTMLLCQEDG